MAKQGFHIPRFFGYAAGIALVYFVLVRLNILPSIGEWFREKPVTIDSTPVMVREVKNIAQLMTVAAYDEVVMDTAKTVTASVPSLFGNVKGESKAQLVLIGRGRVIAGVDLQKLKEEDIYIKADSVSIQLPPAEVLEAIANPSDFEIFSEDGEWPPAEVSMIKIRTKEKMVQRSVQQGLLQKAGSKAVSIMENFLRSAGFKRIHVRI